jgi:hypothetical protein
MSRLKPRLRRDERKNYFFAAAALPSFSLQPDVNQENVRAVSKKINPLPEQWRVVACFHNISGGNRGRVKREGNRVNYFTSLLGK